MNSFNTVYYKELRVAGLIVYDTENMRLPSAKFVERGEAERHKHAHKVAAYVPTLSCTILF